MISLCPTLNKAKKNARLRANRKAKQKADRRAERKANKKTNRQANKRADNILLDCYTIDDLLFIPFTKSELSNKRSLHSDNNEAAQKRLKNS